MMAQPLFVVNYSGYFGFYDEFWITLHTSGKTLRTFVWTLFSSDEMLRTFVWPLFSSEETLRTFMGTLFNQINAGNIFRVRLENFSLN